MSDSWIARKLEAQLAGRYLMPSVLITSTMKSEPGTPPMRLATCSPGACVSAAATCMVGGSADGARATGGGEESTCDGTAVAAPAASAPVRKRRRSGVAGDFLRAIGSSPWWARAEHSRAAIKKGAARAPSVRPARALARGAARAAGPAVAVAVPVAVVQAIRVVGAGIGAA